LGGVSEDRVLGIIFSVLLVDVGVLLLVYIRLEIGLYGVDIGLGLLIFWSFIIYGLIIGINILNDMLLVFIGITRDIIGSSIIYQRVHVL
jgi:hypothetical protein